MMELGNGMGGGAGLSKAQNWVFINLVYKSKKERHDLRKRLEGELNLVRNLVKKVEHCGGSGNGDDMGKLKRVHSEVGSVGWHERRPTDQLSVVVPESSQGCSDNVGKDKGTPKANQLYQSSDFVISKDKIPTSEQNKKPKGLGGKKNGESGSGIGMSNMSSKVFKSCSVLLDKLMKHEHGWVFNTPVDVQALGLHDYFTIIKHPMDLGTVKSRLNTYWYKSPKEFAEDVRLTFHNAMTYNPKGHDVNVMAEILLTMFEEKWSSIEAEYAEDLKASADYEANFLTPTSRKAPPAPLSVPSVHVTKTLEKSESLTTPAAVKPKNSNSTPSGRNPVPKKPKAKDPHKRGMTYVEKQKLSTDLQNLPSDKLDNVVQIIRKRNPTLCQKDDEIEVDIDSVDIETLWELDRFVMNFKKNMSKIKKRAEPVHGREDTEPALEKNETPSVTEEQKEKKAGKII